MKKKYIFIIAIIVLVSAVAAHLIMKNGVKWAVATAISKELGVDVKIDGAILNLSAGRIQLYDLRLMQPSGFDGGALAIAPFVDAEFDREALKQKKVHIKNLTLQISDVVIVKNKSGLLNVDQIRSFREDKNSASKESEIDKESQSADQSDTFKLDQMKLSMNRVVFKDLTGNKPKVTARYLKIEHKKFEGIVNPSQLTMIALGQGITAMSIKSALIYGAAAATGVGLVPAAAALVLSGDANAHGEYDMSQGKLFEAAKDAVNKLGSITSEDPKKGYVGAKIDGNDIDIQITSTDEGLTKIAVTSRKLLVPAPLVAAGTLYTIEEQAL